MSIIDAASKSLAHEIDRAILEAMRFDGMSAVDKLGYLAEHEHAPPGSLADLEAERDKECS